MNTDAVYVAIALRVIVAIAKSSAVANKIVGTTIKTNGVRYAMTLNLPTRSRAAIVSAAIIPIGANVIDVTAAANAPLNRPAMYWKREIGVVKTISSIRY